MKNTLRKIQQKIFAIWQKAKLHISSFVGGQFKKREYNDYRDFDWYYQVSWFDRKWFKHKLKQYLMNNFIYPLFEKSLQTYFVEFGFFTPPSSSLKEYNKRKGTDYLGDFKMYLPLMIKVKNHSQGEYVANELYKTLMKEYNIENIFLFKIGQKPLRDNEELRIIERLNNEFKFAHKTTLEINTYKPNDFGNYNFNNPKINLTDIKVVSVGNIRWNKQFEYTVLITKTINEE